MTGYGFGTRRSKEGGIAAGRRQRSLLGEVVGWCVALALLSPLAVYAGQPMIPLAGLFSVAAGIALSLGLVGRQLHDVLLSDALSGRTDKAKLVLAAGMMLLVALLVLLGVVVALLLVLRGAGFRPPGIL